MFKNEYLLDVDIKKRFSKIIPFYVNGDNAFVVFRVFDNSVPIDLNLFTSAVIRHKLKTSEIVEIVGSISTNGETVSYYLSDEVTNEKGEIDILLSFHTENTRVSIQPFKINII